MAMLEIIFILGFLFLESKEADYDYGMVPNIVFKLINFWDKVFIRFWFICITT